MERCRICIGRPDLTGKTATLTPESGGEIKVSITPTLSRYALCKAGDAVFVCSPAETYPTDEPAYIKAVNEEARAVLNACELEHLANFTPVSACGNN